MNLYVRYFDHECLAHTIEEAIIFLEDIPDISVDSTVPGRIENFLNDEDAYPFRLKVSYSNYVLFLKTEADSLESFHEIERLRREQGEENHGMTMAERKKAIIEELNKPQRGWYEAHITFKRVMMVPDTGKFTYKDTDFAAKCIAESPMDCYNRIMQHLQSRSDLDPRCQYPSARNQNFKYEFLCEVN